MRLFLGVLGFVGGWAVCWGVMSKGSARGREWEDEFTLLCEQCGYVVEGLDVEGACPECGKGIVESLPERRVGTPWQQKPGVGSLVRTWWMTVRHPLRIVRIMRADTPQAGVLRLVPIVTASALVNGSVALVQGLSLHELDLLDSGSFLRLVMSSGVWLVVCILALLVLTTIETLGIRFLSRRHGTRISRSLGESITTHGCVGWILGAVLCSMSLLVGDVILEITTPKVSLSLSDFGSMDELVQAVQNAQVPTAPGWADWVFTWLPRIGLLIGFLFFETFAWLGLRRCKYANRARPGGVEGGESPAVAS